MIETKTITIKLKQFKTTLAKNVEGGGRRSTSHFFSHLFTYIILIYVILFKNLQRRKVDNLMVLKLSPQTYTCSYLWLLRHTHMGVPAETGLVKIQNHEYTGLPWTGWDEASNSPFWYWVPSLKLFTFTSYKPAKGEGGRQQEGKKVVGGKNGEGRGRYEGRTRRRRVSIGHTVCSRPCDNSLASGECNQHLFISHYTHKLVARPNVCCSMSHDVDMHSKICCDNNTILFITFEQISALWHAHKLYYTGTKEPYINTHKLKWHLQLLSQSSAMAYVHTGRGRFFSECVLLHTLWGKW